MLDLNNLGNLAKEATNLANNPMAQQVLNNPTIVGLVNEAEKYSGMDLDGNGSIGSVATTSEVGENHTPANVTPEKVSTEE